MPTLNSLPDDLQAWKVGNEFYLVTAVPGTNPPVYLAWTVTEAQLQDAFGPGQEIVYNETISESEFSSVGALVIGDHDDIAETRENPFDVLQDQFERMAAIQPWLEDPEVLALMTEAMYEGLGNDWLAEMITTTTWWRTRTEGERAWAELSLKDPATAEQRLRSNELVVAEFMKQAGIDQAPAEIVEYIALQATTGAWTEADWQLQVKALSDPYSGIEVDETITSLLGGTAINTTRNMEEEVRNLLLRWLGPVHGLWDDAQIAQVAGEFRNNPDAELGFTEYLQQQRIALFPQYENPSLSYDDIAAPWRNFVTQAWGQTPDELDPLFAQIIKNNDSAINGALLRAEGLKRGIGQVTTSASDGFASAFGQIRRPL